MRKKFVVIITCVLLLCSLLVVASCDKGQDNKEVAFTYPEATADSLIGSGTNPESHNYNSLRVTPVENMRDDFIMGVDASMVYDVELNGGKYYNSQGQEQDVFKIMAASGVNFFRVRVWNDPANMYGDKYGGGDNTVEVAISLAKRAQNAGMNIMVDFHYSDFWADPEYQDIPKAWSSYTDNEIVSAVGTFTKNSLNAFKAAGVNVAMVQIGNEINNGMLFPAGTIKWGGQPEIDSFDFISRVLKSGISGAKSAFSKIYTAIHLANGGNAEEFDVFFSHLKRNGVDYDAIGLSYYPYYHGTLEALQNNMNATSQKFGKPVFVAELAYGFTDQYNEYTANTYSSATEDAGKYLTSVQGQATAVRDVINAVAGVPGQKGLGVFYWEPAWLPVKNSGWANKVSGRTTENGLNTWANQALFSYTGKALPSLNVFSLVKGSQTVTETPLKLRYTSVDYTINIADNEALPATVAVETDLDAIRQTPVVWNKSIDTVGSHTVTGTVALLAAPNNVITAKVTSIRNFIKDPGYEKQGKTDEIIAPWVIEQNTLGEKVVKLDRKTDMRSGTTNLNWYHSSAPQYSFTVTQTLSNLPDGLFELTVWLMGPNSGAVKNDSIIIFIEYGNGQREECDMTDELRGWGTNSYVQAKISNVPISGGTAKVGISVTSHSGAWAHVDDWALVLTD